AEYFADYSQWESTRDLLPPGEGGPERSEGPDEGRKHTKRLTYLEQREFDSMEQTLLIAEEHLADARRRAEDPSIASDATALQQRFAELAQAEAEVDRLYRR